MFRSMIQSRGRGAGFVSPREAARQNFPILGIDQRVRYPWMDLMSDDTVNDGPRRFFNMTWSLFTIACSHQAVAITCFR